MADKNIPTAESLAKAVGAEAVSPERAPYSRIVFYDRTLAYASERKDGILLDFSTSDVVDAPSRFQRLFEGHDGRTLVRVTTRNVKGATALLEWVAKQVSA